LNFSKGLSGTLFRNSPKDIWAELTLLGFNACKKPGQFTLELYEQLGLKDTVLRVLFTKQAGIELPVAEFHNIVIPQNENERLLYNLFMNLQVFTINEAQEESSEINQGTVLAVFMYLRQICTCPISIVKTVSKE
jgi:hypothetical protein